ncbi:hypothetical protein ACVDG5_032300 [Mesorhizobium sp. ORM6]
MKAFFLALLMGAATALGSAPSVAQDRNAVILTVDGAIAGGKARDFSIADLEALGTAQIKSRRSLSRWWMQKEGASFST